MNWNDLLAVLWRTTWQASVMAAAVWICALVLRGRLAPQWRSRLWWVVAIRFALPVLPVLPASPVSPFNLYRAAPTAAMAVPVATPRFHVSFNHADGVAPAPAAPAASATPLPARHTGPLLGIFWLAGAAALAARWAMANLRFARKLRRSASAPDAATKEILQACGAPRRLKVLATAAVSSPSLFGLFRPKLLIPPDFSQSLSPAEIRWVVLHELAHLRRQDCAAEWFMSILRIVHWFNPIAWLAFASWRADMETACDEAVVCKPGEAECRDYGLLLLKLAARAATNSPPALMAMADGLTELRRRLRAIATPRRSPRWTPVAALLLVFVATCGLTSAAAPATAPAAKAENAISIHCVIYDVDQQTLLRANGAVGQASLAVSDKSVALMAGDDLSKFVAAMNQAVDSNVVYSPRLLVSDGKRADLMIGASTNYVSKVQVAKDGRGPYSAATDTVFDGLDLKIAAHITEDGKAIVLDTRISQSKLMGFKRVPLGNGDPAAEVQAPMEQSWTTSLQLHIPDGKSAVMTLGAGGDGARLGDSPQRCMVMALTPAIVR